MVSQRHWGLSCTESLLDVQGCGVRQADWGNMVDRIGGSQGRFFSIQILFVAYISRYLKNSALFSDLL